MDKKKSLSLVLILLALNLVFVSGVSGTVIVDLVICHEVDLDTREPIEEGSVFFNHVSDIFAWVRLSSIENGQSLRFIWSSPGGVIVADNEIIITSSETDYWDQFFIKGYLPEQDPGEWSVSIYINGILTNSKLFKILNYEAIELENDLALLAIERLSEELAELYGNYSLIQDSIVSYQTDIAQLSTSYDELFTEYSTIQEGYNTTQNDLQELLVEYGNIHGNYTALSDEYEALSDELSTTKKSLNNTRTLLYGSSGLALVLLLVSAYLVNKGRDS